MTKKYLLAAILLPVSSVVWSQVDADLSHSAEKAKKIVQSSRKTRSDSAAKQDDKTLLNSAVPAQGTDLIVMKDLLKDVPADERSEFLNNLTVSEGSLLSADLKALRKKLSDEQVTSIVAALAPKPGAKDKQAKSKPGRKLFLSSELLQGVPKPVADEFLLSMTIHDGHIVSADIGALRKAVSEKRLIEILNSLAEAEAQTPQRPGLKGLCGNGWCDDSICTSTNQEPLHCATKIDKTCWSTCR